MEWEATERAEVVKVALPELSRALLPSVVVPSVKVTVPPGSAVADDAGATVAVNVMPCPQIGEGVSEASVVVVSTWLVTWPG